MFSIPVFKNNFIYLFRDFWLCRVFLASWAFLHRGQRRRLCSFRARASLVVEPDTSSVVVVPGLSCFVAGGILYTRDWTHFSCIVRQILYLWTTRGVPSVPIFVLFLSPTRSSFFRMHSYSASNCPQGFPHWRGTHTNNRTFIQLLSRMSQPYSHYVWAFQQMLAISCTRSSSKHWGLVKHKPKSTIFTELTF